MAKSKAYGCLLWLLSIACKAKPQDQGILVSFILQQLESRVLKWTHRGEEGKQDVASILSVSFA